MVDQSIELALREAREELDAVYDGATEGLLTIEAETQRVVRANRAICDLLGYSETELRSLSVADIHPAASLAEMQSGVEAARQGRVNSARNIPCLRKDGRVVYVDIAVRRLTCGPKPLLLALVRDITEQHRALQRLRESETTLRGLLENLPDFVLMVDRNAVIQFANRPAPDGDRDALLGACGFGFIVPEHREACQHALQEAFRTGAPQAIDAIDVFGHWWTCRLVSLAKEGDPEHALVICADVSQERMATEAVDKEQRLLRQLLELHERERQLAAYDIHDGFAQQLAGALFRLQGFREAHGRNPAKAWEDFDAAMRLICRAIDETRRLISGLRPPILDESGVVHAIEYLVCECQRQGGPTIEFAPNVTFGRLASPLESALFRIAQESLQNACRHSRSDRIRIDLAERDGRVCLDVRDWGVGFSLGAVDERHFGLQGVRERVRLLGGRVTIESAPGEGTRISAELPLVAAAPASTELE